MAQDFSTWLESCYFNLASHRDSRITTVGIVGKETDEYQKASIIDQFLLEKQCAFECGSWIPDPETSPISVLAYFALDSSTLYLLLNGIHNVEAQVHLFSSGKFRHKSFFEKMAIVEMEEVHLMHLLFIVCHVIIFVEQACRFDTHWIRTLKAVKSLRIKAERLVKNTLADVPGCPKTWAEEGRIAVPQMLFAFNRNPLRPEMGVAKKRELLEKMEKSLEGQLVSLLKHHRIVDNYSPESALASLPPIPHVFAHIFRHKEWSGSMESTASELLEDLFGNNRLDDVDAFLAELESSCDLNGAQGERPRRHAEPDFCSFVNNAISNLRKSDSSSSKTSSTRDTMFEFPKLKHFINAGKSVYRALLEERNFDFTSVAQMINAEVLLEEEATDECVSKAKGVYEQELKKGALSAFSKQEHEEKLQSALKFLTCRLPEGERRNRLLKDLTADCTNIWKNGHQRCEAVSLTEHRCSLAVHDLQISHLSGYQLLSTCNCGRSQAVREDPFSAKQANLDFYQQTDAFDCCAKLDRIELPVFDLPVLELEGIEEIVFKESRLPEGLEFEGAMNPGTVRILTKKDSEEEANFVPSISPPLPTRLPLSPPNLEAESSDLDPIMDRQLASQAYALSDDEFASLPGQECELAQGRRRDDSQATSESESIADTKEDDESEVAGQARKHSRGSSPDLEGESEDDLAKGSEKSASIGNRAKNESESSRDTQRGKSRLESHYLDSYDVHLTEGSRSAGTMASTQITGVTSTRFEEIAEKLKGKFLEHTPFTFTNKFQAHASIPRLLPLYSSWSVVCHGSSSVYNHASGLRNQPNFKTGSDYLLPWDVHLTVNGEQWDKDMVAIAPAGMADRQGRARGQRSRPLSDNGKVREKVKLFVGFDYECQRGHRFMVQNPGKALRHRRTNGTLTLDAASLMSSAQPMWMACTCKREPKQIAQLMHIHVVTPKAPVTVTLSPKVRMEACPEGYFHPGTENEAVDLGRAKYYVLRLPFAYIMPQGAIDVQKKTPGMSRDGDTWISPGHLLADCIEVKHTPIAQ